MTLRLRRPKPGLRYIIPRFSPGTGVRLERGALRLTKPLREKSLTKLGFRFTPAGIKQPRYKETRENPEEIERDKPLNVEKPYTLSRMHRHELKSIRMETLAIASVVRQISAVHASVVSKWGKLSEEDKKFLITHTKTIKAAMGNPNQLRSHYKQQVIIQLGEALGHMEKIEKVNTSAAATKLWRAANDAVGRINQLRKERRGIQRQTAKFLEKMSIEQRRLEKYLDDNTFAFNALKKFNVSTTDLAKIADQMDHDIHSVAAKRELELKESQPFLKAALAALRGRDFNKCRQQLVQANRKVLEALGRQYLLSPKLLQQLVRSPNVSLKKKILQEQLDMLADNAVFWHERAQKMKNANERVKRMIDYVQWFSRAYKTVLPDPDNRIYQASLAIKNGNLTIAEEKLFELARPGEMKK